MITVTVSLWALAFVCFLLATLLPFLNVSTGRLNLVALGLTFAALSHLWPLR